MEQAAAPHSAAIPETTTGLDHRKMLMWLFLGSDTLFFGVLNQPILLCILIEDQPVKYLVVIGGIFVIIEVADLDKLQFLFRLRLRHRRTAVAEGKRPRHKCRENFQSQGFHE